MNREVHVRICEHLGVKFPGVTRLVAEAGTGKSRLFYEFKSTIPAECKVLEAYSVSHGKASSWLPMLELLRGYFDLAEMDDTRTRREKVRAAVLGLDAALEDTLPYLYGLLGLVEGPDPHAQMDPRIKFQRTLDAIKRIVLRESLRQPSAVVFEDLHWVDEQTQALLDLLANSIVNSRVLLLFNYRPEYRHNWTNKSYYAQLGLDPLGGENAASLLTGLIGETKEVEPLKQVIIERSGGNPFFIEEMVQTLFDAGALVRNGALKVTRSLSQLRLPPTVQGILAARIDRQPTEHKQLLQTLAVIGREARLGLIRKVVPTGELQLRERLAELQETEFIYEQPAFPDPEYVFKHALTQEVAYNSLLIERRKILHERVGQALESMFADQLDDHLVELAHHYSHTDNVSKAVEYLGRAGQQALQRSAHLQAIDSLSAAVALVQKLPDTPERIQRELFLQLALGPALMTVNGWAAPDVEQAYTRARVLCDHLGDPPEAFPALAGLFYLYLLRAELRTAHELAERMMGRAKSAQDPALLVIAHVALGQVSFHLSELLLAREHLEAAVSIYRREHHAAFARLGTDIGVPALSFLARTLWLLGYPEQAYQRANEALALARGLSHPPSVAFATQFIGVLHQYQGDAAAVKETSERVTALSLEHGLTFWLAVAHNMHGWATAMHQHERAIIEMQEGWAAFRATGTQLDQPYWACLRAEVYRAAGRISDAQTALSEALVATHGHEDRHYEAEVHRVKGEFLLRQSDSNLVQAKNCFELAIEIARKQGAKSWELRAATSLTRLLRDTERRNEARAMLAQIYNWFSEGFDTSDLKDAKALLDELGNSL
jgi:predicted ATPase